MVQNIRPDISNTVNTVFSEQRIVESQPAHPSSITTLSSKVEAEMADESWFAKQQLMKPVQLAQLQWTSAQARDTDIYTCHFPAVLTSVESIVLRTLRMYAFFKMSPCFRVQINSTQFHQGQLICSFDPFTLSQRGNPVDNTFVYDYFYATGLPNVKVMASESDAVELCVPFVHPISFWTTNDPDIANFQDLGSFRITVLNPLVVAEGTSPTVTVTVWVYAKDAQVHVPIFDHPPLVDPANQVSVVATSGFLSDLSSQFSGITNQLTSTLSPVISSVRKIGGQAHTMYGNVVSGNFGQALRTGQGLVDSLGDMFGFDYPARTIQPPKTISPVENLSVGIGQSQSQRMAIDPFSLHVVDDEVAGESIDAMNILRIAKMPMLLNQFQFAGTAPQDTLLFSCPVTPTVSSLRNGAFKRTYLSAVSNAFCYWNGGINFDIEVVATRFHSGKLLFAFVPSDVAIPSYISAADGLPNIIVDIQQSSSTRFKIPFVSSKPLKDVQRNNPTYINSPSPDPNDTNYNDSCIGTLVCYVQNILNYASNVSPQVEVNMYISAGDDFGLYVPGKPMINRVPPTETPQVVATSNEIGIDLNKNNAPMTAAVLAKGQLNSIPRKHFGEDYSLIDLLRRFTYYTSVPINTTQLVNVTPFDINVPSIDTSYLQYFTYLYSAFAGSLRYKLVIGATRNVNTTVEITHIPSPAQLVSMFDPDAPDVYYQSGGLGLLRTNAQQDCAIEAEVPYYSKYNMLVPYIANPDVNSNGYILIRTNLPATDTTTADVYIAAGEDFRYIYLRPFISDRTNIGYYVQTLP